MASGDNPNPDPLDSRGVEIYCRNVLGLDTQDTGRLVRSMRALEDELVAAYKTIAAARTALQQQTEGLRQALRRVDEARRAAKSSR